MNRLKVGVLTFHRCINYGSYWQALCLVEALRAKGHDAVLLDHYSKRVNIAEWKCAYQPVLPMSVPTTDYPLYRQKIERFFEDFEKLPLSTCFPLDDPAEMDNYDLVVVGSDEVWNLFHPWYGGNALFYGDGIRADRLISYAASFGNYDASFGLEQPWAEKLRNFESISIRDDNSRTIIRNALGIEPELVLDPCLAFPPKNSHFENNVSAKQYVAVYGHNFSKIYTRNIREWAAHRNLPLISIGYRNDWVDEQWLTAGPNDFAHFIAGSEAVATNFFHGCVFALLNQKPFATESTSYRSIKVGGLMDKVGGLKHLLNESTTVACIASILNHPLEESIVQKIETLRKISNAFLDRAVKAKQHQFA